MEKRLPLLLALVVLVVFAAVWFAAWPSLRRRLADAPRRLPAEAVEALRRDPHPLLCALNPDQNAAAPRRFRGYPIVKEINVTGDRDRRRLADFVLRGLSQGSGPGGPCVGPEHAVRVSDGRRTYDFLIGFRCGELALYEPGSPKAAEYPLGRDLETALFDELLSPEVTVTVEVAETPAGN